MPAFAGIRFTPPAPEAADAMVQGTKTFRTDFDPKNRLAVGEFYRVVVTTQLKLRSLEIMKEGECPLDNPKPSCFCMGTIIHISGCLSIFFPSHSRPGLI